MHLLQGQGRKRSGDGHPVHREAISIDRMPLPVTLAEIEIV